jgi:hypothetical protein
MRRALAALFLAPILGGLVYGYFAIIAIPVMVATAALVALPLFFLLRRLHWLQWWVVSGAGALCSLAFALLYWFTSPPYHVEYTGARNVLFFVGNGTLVGLLFWWIGIFRNGAFTFVSRGMPISMVMMIPLAGVALWMHERLEPHMVDGRVSGPEQSGRIQLRLADGMVIQARLPADFEKQAVVGQCVVLSERWSITQLEKLYFIHAAKPGPKSDDC